MTEKSTTDAQRWRPRFGLRWLLIVTLLIAVWLGWMMKRNRQAKIERQVVERLRKEFEGFEAFFHFDFEYGQGEEFIYNAKRPKPNWLTNLFDEYPFVSCKSLSIIFERGIKLENLDDIGKLKSLEHLSIECGENIGSLDPLESLTQLNNVNLRYFSRIKDITPLENNLSLESLDIEGSPDLTSVECVRNFPKLKYLRLFGTGVTDLSPLESAQELETLTLVGDFDSIDELRNSTRIQHLAINSESLNDFEILRKLTQIKSLDIHCDHLTSLDAFCELKNLETLEVVSKNLTSIEGIRNLKKLKTLRFECGQLEDITALKGKSIEDLSFRSYASPPSHPHKLSDLSGIDNLPELKTLNLTNCSNKDFSKLKNLPKLEVLTAEYCRSLESVDGLDQIPSLVDVELDQCSNLKNLDGLRGLNQLEVLGCWHCDGLTDVSPLKSLPKIRRINFYESKNVAGGEFFLEMKPNALTEIQPDENKLELTPLDAFLNLEGTSVDEELIYKLRDKYPGVEIKGNREETFPKLQ